MTDAVGLVPLISFFHPQRLWLLAAVPLLLLLYFGLLQRSRTRGSWVAMRTTSPRS